MNVILQKHNAKHIYKVPEGLRELCTDITREVLRSQPANLHAFIAEYVDTLLITRENTKIAVKVVNNILLESQAILSILYRTGFTLEQITVAAPRIQKAFREYLDTVDTRPVQVCEDPTCDEKSMISIRDILEATGATREIAERAAVVIQAAFRGHYERMALNEAQGKIQWQRAVTNTLDILRKAGASQAEIIKAARHIKFAYRGYYIRRNQRIDPPGTEVEPLKKDERILETTEAIQAVAWMEMMYEDSGLTMEKANEAAYIIQKAYKKYRARRRCYDVQQLETTKTMVAEAVIDKLHHKIFTKVTSRDDVPADYGTKEEMMVASTKLQVAIKEQMRTTRVITEEYLEEDESDEEEEYEGEDMEDEPFKSEGEEQLTEEETEKLPEPEAEVTTEPLTVSPESQSAPETERPSEPEAEETTQEAAEHVEETGEEERPEEAAETDRTEETVETERPKEAVESETTKEAIETERPEEPAEEDETAERVEEQEEQPAGEEPQRE